MMTIREAEDYARKRFGPQAIFVQEVQDGRTYIHVGGPSLVEGTLKAFGCGRTHEEALRDADLHYERAKRPKEGERPRRPTFPAKFYRKLPTLPPLPQARLAGTLRSLEAFYTDGSSLTLTLTPPKVDLEHLEF